MCSAPQNVNTNIYNKGLMSTTDSNGLLDETHREENSQNFLCWYYEQFIGWSKLQENFGRSFSCFLVLLL